MVRRVSPAENGDDDALGQDDGGSSAGRREDSTTGSVMLSRRAVGTLAVAGSLSLAGCSGFFGDDDGGEATGSGAEDELAFVPEAADGALFADEKMATDEETAVVLTGLVDVGTDLPETGESEMTYATLVVELAASEVAYIDSTFFYRDEEDGNVAYQAAVVRTDGDSDGVRSWVETNVGSLSSETYADTDIDIAETDEGELWLAEIDASTVILGAEPAVTDAIDVEQGAEDGLSGGLAAAYDAAGNGHMKALVTLGDGDLEAILEGVNESLAGGLGLLPEPEIMTAMYATDELEDDGGTLLEEIGGSGPDTGDESPTAADDGEEETEDDIPDDTFAMQLTLETEDDAESFKETIELVLDGDDPVFGDELEDDDLLSRLAVERDGEHVTISFTTTSEELADFFNGAGAG